MLSYFELFGIPVTLRPDKADLRRRFFERSREAHPDHYARESDAAQAEALERSAQLNKAYKTLTDEDELARYVLQEKGLMQPEEKYALAPDFLMEMMELNEEVPDALSDAAARERLMERLRQWKNEIYAPVENTMEHYQEGVTSEKELLQVKEYYYRKKYLQRLAGQLGQKL
ncbi:MAG: co-chaperone Hsc20 [Chitinophagaceae bacterium]|nr:MAG: co-chaperone Hsc20 [Chitinophagaceae bacterium]